MKKLFNALAVFLLLACSHLTFAANPLVEFKTNMGNFTVEVLADKAPKTSANFLKYVKDGFYSGTIFHRVMGNFMIQGGGFTPDMREKNVPYAPIENEAPESTPLGLKNTTGMLAMARTMHPHSASAQFFINVKDNNFLDFPGQDGWGYAVFGKVVKGIDVVMKIRGVQTGNKGMHENVPTSPVIIESATLLVDKPANEKK